MMLSNLAMILPILSIMILAISAEDLPVTCSSVVKLESISEHVRLHSHDVKYGSGSGQQSVTGMPTTDDVNSHWQILGGGISILW